MVINLAMGLHMTAVLLRPVRELASRETYNCRRIVGDGRMQLGLKESSYVEIQVHCELPRCRH